MIGRRGFIAGLASLIAAPAIVQASSLMPVRGIVMPVSFGEPLMAGLTAQVWDDQFFTEYLLLNRFA